MKLENELESIVTRCQTGDRSAFIWLFKQYQPKLKYFVLRLGGTGSNTDDILQDIWMIILSKINTLKKPGLFPAWLYRIARNKVYDNVREKKRAIPISISEEAELPASYDNELDFQSDEAEKIHQALGKMKPEHREVLTLFFLEQMSYQSIAEVTECSLGTVRSRIYHAKKSLREKLERQYG